MKVKITKRKGVQYLEVADELINSSSQHGSPIILAVMTNFADSECWCFEDYRLNEYLLPSKYLNDSHEQIPDFKNYPEADRQLVLSKLHDYSLDENGGLSYWRYDGVNLDGDIPEDSPKRTFTNGKPYPKRACFSFKAAQKKLSEAKEFWTNYEGLLTDDSLKLPHPHRQPSKVDYFFDLSVTKQQMEAVKKNKIK